MSLPGRYVFAKPFNWPGALLLRLMGQLNRSRSSRFDAVSLKCFPDGRRDSTFGFETRQAVRGGAFYFDRCSNSHLNYGGLIPSTDLEPAADFSQLVLESATLR